MKHDAHHVQLAIDVFMQPKTLLLYQRMIRKLDIHKATRHMEEIDIDMLFR